MVGTLYIGGGTLDIEEFSAIVKKFCPDITDRQLRHLMSSADADNSGSLDRDEFIEFLNDRPGEDEVEIEKSPYEKHVDGVRENFNVFHRMIINTR